MGDLRDDGNDFSWDVSIEKNFLVYFLCITYQSQIGRCVSYTKTETVACTENVRCGNDSLTTVQDRRRHGPTSRTIDIP